MDSSCLEIDICFPFAEATASVPVGNATRTNAWFQPIERTGLRLTHRHKHVEDTAIAYIEFFLLALPLSHQVGRRAGWVRPVSFLIPPTGNRPLLDPKGWYGEVRWASNQETGTHIHRQLVYQHCRSLASFVSLSSGGGLDRARGMASGSMRTTGTQLA